MAPRHGEAWEPRAPCGSRHRQYQARRVAHVPLPLRNLLGAPHAAGPFCHRALLTLEEKHVPYTKTYIDFNDKPQWLFEVRRAGAAAGGGSPLAGQLQAPPVLVRGTKNQSLPSGPAFRSMRRARCR